MSADPRAVCGPSVNAIHPPGLEPIVPAPLPDRAWPEPIGGAARVGLAGEVVSAIEPTTEGDPNAILIQLLAGMGNLLGRKPHVLVDEKPHPLKLWALVVGRTGDGKKGTGANRVFSLLDDVDPSWRRRRKGSIASGEAIVHEVRDDRERVKRVRDAAGHVTETADTLVGEADKRLFLKEEEFARVLRLVRREGSSLSATLREAWDTDLLMTTAKTAPATATGAHVTVVGHIVPEELRGGVPGGEIAGGLVNRFLLAASRRSRRLAWPPPLAPERRAHLVAGLRRVQEWVDGLEDGRLELAPEALGVWAGLKDAAEEEVERCDACGLALGRIIARGPPYLLRLAALYAVLDSSRVIAVRHLEAASAVWRYSVATARWVFGDGLNDPDALKVLAALEARPLRRLTRLEVGELFCGHRRQAELDRVRDLLIRAGKIDAHRQSGGQGRPTEVWTLRRQVAAAG